MVKHAVLIGKKPKRLTPVLCYPICFQFLFGCN